MLITNMDFNKIERREYNINGKTFTVMNATKLYIDILYASDYEEGVPYRIRLKDYNGLFYFNDNEEQIFLCDEGNKLILNNQGDPCCSFCKNLVGMSEENAGYMNKIGEAFCRDCYNNVIYPNLNISKK